MSKQDFRCTFARDSLYCSIKHGTEHYKIQQTKQFRRSHWIQVTAQRKYVAIYCTNVNNVMCVVFQCTEHSSPRTLERSQIWPNIQRLGTADVTAHYLADLCNLCITDCVFPIKQKLAKVIPVYESGDKTQPSKHRPISLLSHFSKIFEKLVFGNLLSLIAPNNITLLSFLVQNSILSTTVWFSLRTFNVSSATKIPRLYPW